MQEVTRPNPEAKAAELAQNEQATTTNKKNPALTAQFDVVKRGKGDYVAVTKAGGDIIATGKTDAAARKAGYAKLDAPEPSESDSDASAAS